MLYTEDFLKYLELERNYSSRTINSYKEDLHLFDLFLCEQQIPLDPALLTSDILRAWIIDMMEHHQKASSVCRRLSTLRTFFKYLLSKDKISSDPTRQVKGPKKEKPLPYFLKENEINFLLDSSPESYSYSDVRDQLIIKVFYETGIRLSELLNLETTDIELDSQYIKVTGKRNKQRIIPYGKELQDDITHFLKIRKEEFKEPIKTLFLSEKGEQMTPYQVRKCVKNQLSKVSTLKKQSPHVLRHTFATTMLNHQANLEAVKELLGHKSLSTTEIYTHTTFEELKKIYNKAHPRS